MFSFSNAHVKKRGIIRGFTLVELLVVFGIVVIITTLMLARNSKFNDTILLTNLAYDIALSVRQAQVFGLSVREAVPGGGNFSSSYGVRIGSEDTNGVSPMSYVMCADRYDDFNSICDQSPSEVIETFTIGKGHYVSGICGYWIGTTECTEISHVDIFYERPNPEAIITRNIDEGLADSVEITVSSADDEQSRVIVVNINGQISVQQP